MSIITSSQALGFLGAAGGYEISRSIRLNSADSAYLSRTPASAGNRKTWTWAGWVKRSAVGASGNAAPLFTSYVDTSNYSVIDFVYDKLRVETGSGSGPQGKTTTQVFRDLSSWYHIVVSSNNLSTLKVYVNGVEVTSFSTNVTVTGDYQFSNTNPQWIGREQYSTANTYFNGLLADIHFCDGTAYDASAFGEFSATTGVWMPKRFAGTYGTNGFKLDFSDNSAATATTLGKDSSGNGNNFTPNNLSVTAGAGNDSLVDVPVNGTQPDTGAGGEVRGNYATLNPLDVGANISNAQGNLYALKTTTGWTSQRSTIGVSSGKYYFEALATGTIDSSGAQKQAMIGVANNLAALSTYIGVDANGWSYNFDGLKINSGAGSSYGATFTGGDIIGVAVDMDNGKIWFAKNGTWQASGNPAAGTNAAFTNVTGTVMPAIGLGGLAAGNVSWDMNYGARPFTYTAPSGFKALCTQNLPAPTITKPSTVMDVALWTGNGSARSITGLGFNPDLVWIKGRSGATDHALYDSVRGAEKRLESNTTDAEVTSDGGVTAFNSDGFSLGTLAQVNTNTETYAGWTWDAGSSTVTNTDGTISSQVRANASAGFSIVSYDLQATGSKTVGHGLGVAPSLIIAIPRNVVHNTFVYHASVGATAFLYLNTTAAISTNSTVWDNTSPTSSVFTLGSGWTSGTYGTAQVAYCFAPVAGYSAYGSYTGNGSADGPFVYTGFRPRWLLIKSTAGSSVTDYWFVWDTARATFNPMDAHLYPNSSLAEQAPGTTNYDALSNGFKVRNTFAGLNTNAQTYIYAAFAESPFALARAR